MACGCGPGGCGAHKRDESFDPDFEGPSEADIAKFGTDDIECPDCGASVYFDAPMCPRCGYALAGGAVLTRSAKARSRRNAFIGIGAALALAGFILATML
jgi:hypothetical protein